MNITITNPAPILTVNIKPGEEVIRIDADGTLYWKGRLIETDDEFKAAMMALSRYMRGDYSDSVPRP